MTEKKETKKKVKKSTPKGVVHVQNTFNNTIVTVTDMNGNTVSWSSAGALKFRGAKKSTPFASQMVAAAACETAVKLGMREVKILINGPGFGRESAIRAVSKAGLQITQISDITGIPHNGCRPRKIRRI